MGQLKESIISLSNADEWDIAREEWSLFSIHKNEEGSSCECGQSIKKCCVILNQHNNQELTVGTTCLEYFERNDFNISKAFYSLRNLLNAPTLSTIRVNSELLTVAFNAGVLNQRELVSYEEHRKAKTQIYIMMYEEFNQRIIDRFSFN